MTIVEERVRKLNTASARRIIEPDVDVPGHVGPGQLIPDDLLEELGLDLRRLTPEQKVTLSREMVAAMYDFGLRIESALIAGFAAALTTSDTTDPRTVYMLHEMGEETRHSRLFSRVIADIGPQAKLPFVGDPRLRFVERVVTGISFFVGMQFPSAFNAMVLTGEEIPDLFQKKMVEHPESDPFVADVSRYHRLEEARHLSFARMRVPELWERSWWGERYVVRRVLPLLMSVTFDAFTHPGVYASVGLPGVRTWLALRKSPRRRAVRATALRPVLQALVDGGALGPGRINRRWQGLCHVDRHGRPVAQEAA